MLRGHIVQKEPINKDIGLFDIDIPSWPFMLVAGTCGLLLGVLACKVLK